jgi:hypothetical protein
MTDLDRQGPVLTTDENRFRLDGDLIDLWGIRTASATASDDQCQHLIDQLNQYAAHGVNAVTVFFMGCSGSNYDPFSPDGTEIDEGHVRRMQRIVEACAERDMVVVVGIFYQHAPFGLEDADAVRAAVRRVAEHLRPYGNVVLNIANEHTSWGWRDATDVFDFQDPDRILELCEVVHDVDSDRLVGGGGYHPETCAVIGRSAAADIVTFDTGDEELTGFDSGAIHDRLVRAGVHEKPIVNVELFGGWTDNFPRGVYPPEARHACEEELERAAARPGLSVFFHSNPWCQTPDLPLRYDLGGQGTADDPGIRWYFELVRAVRERADSDSPTGGI